MSNGGSLQGSPALRRRVVATAARRDKPPTTVTDGLLPSLANLAVIADMDLTERTMLGELLDVLSQAPYLQTLRVDLRVYVRDRVEYW